MQFRWQVKFPTALFICKQIKVTEGGKFSFSWLKVLMNPTDYMYLVGKFSQVFLNLKLVQKILKAKHRG